MEDRKKVSLSLTLFLVSAVLMALNVVGLFLLALYLPHELSQQVVKLSPMVKAITLISYSLSSVASIVEIIALINTRKVNKIFKIAFTCAIASLCFSLATTGLLFIPANFVFLASMCNMISTFLEISVFFIYMVALTLCHSQDGNEELVKFGSIVEWTYVISTFIYAIFMTSVLANAKQFAGVAVVFAIIGAILCLVGYGIFIFYVIKSKKSIMSKTGKIVDIPTDDGGDPFVG